MSVDTGQVACSEFDVAVGVRLYVQCRMYMVDHEWNGKTASFNGSGYS